MLESVCYKGIQIDPKTMFIMDIDHSDLLPEKSVELEVNDRSLVDQASFTNEASIFLSNIYCRLHNYLFSSVKKKKVIS